MLLSSPLVGSRLARRRGLHEPSGGAGTVHKAALPPAVAALVEALFDAAGSQLTSQLQCSVTNAGIRSSVGVLSTAQVDKAALLLRQMAQAVGELDQALRAGAAERPELLGPLDADESAALKEKLVELQRQYRAALPHAGRVEVGRVEEDGDEDEEYVAGVSRRALVEAGELLALLRDALRLRECSGSVLAHAPTEQSYAALGCTVRHIERGTAEFGEVMAALRAGARAGASCSLDNIYITPFKI